jgi:hypothetical protein
MSGASTSAKKNTGKRVCDELTVQKFNNTATNIAGTATNVHVALKEIDQGGASHASNLCLLKGSQVRANMKLNY